MKKLPQYMAEDSTEVKAVGQHLKTTLASPDNNHCSQ